MREPVAIAAAVRGIILAAVAFGLNWTVEQVAALMFAVEAVLALVVRQSVTPNVTATELIQRTASTGVAQSLNSLVVAILIGGTVLVGACAKRADGTNVSPEGTFALRGTAVVNAITNAAPALETLTLPNSCGQQACLTAQEGLDVATKVRDGLGHAQQLPGILTTIDNASSAAERTAGFDKARAVITEVIKSLNAGVVLPTKPEARLKVVLVLQSAQLALLAIGGF